MQSGLMKLRSLRTPNTGRIINLLKNIDCEPAFENKMMQLLRVVEISRNKEKYDDILNKLETHLIKRKNFNFIVNNLPVYATEQSTNQIVFTNYENIRDTLSQFGKIEQLEVVNSTAYVRFASTIDAKRTHSLINNMMIGDNIIHTTVV
jgi:hypothetical protein